MRSPSELTFRLRQEGLSLFHWLVPPRMRRLPGPPVHPPKPDPAGGAAIVPIAERCLAGQVPVFGTWLDHPGWRRDPTTGIDAGLRYFRLLPYLDPARAGDHKWLWEINRHQHLVTVAQACHLTGRPEFARWIEGQLASWMDANPWLRGMNWTSALEVAFRALSWFWIDRFAGSALPARFRERWMECLYRHGRYLENNLSVYFSPNTHLLGEAVALHALGAAYPDWSRSWAAAGDRIVREQLRTQVRTDGSHFEQSAYYHVYALDMFLLHFALAGDPSPDEAERLRAMAVFLDALLGPQGTLPLLGDDDGGRLFHPFGRRDRFGRATLAAAGVLLGEPSWIREASDFDELGLWWFGGAHVDPAASRAPEPRCQLFRDAGIAVFSNGVWHAVADAGPFGPGSGGHSHSDTLSLVLRRGDEEILIDPGTFTYVGDPAARNSFRGSAAHNTLRIGGKDQATPAGPFRWLHPPRVDIRSWGEDHLDAVCSYGAFQHRRILRVGHEPFRIEVTDEVDGPPGPHLVEQFWHAGEAVLPESRSRYQIGQSVRLHLNGDASIEPGARSRVFGRQEPAPVIVRRDTTALPVRWTTVIGE